MASLQDLQAAKLEAVQRYLAVPGGAFAARIEASRAIDVPGPDLVENLVGVGIGTKVVETQLVGELSVKFYVRKKHLAAEIPDTQLLPETINGIPTDVEEVGFITALQQACTINRKQRQRPAPCGISVGHFNITAGTIGALVRDQGSVDNGKRYIVSNNHVLADCNKGTVGDNVLQPGPIDDPVNPPPAANRLGTLARFVRIDFAGLDNTVDCAIAEVADGTVLNEICTLGSIGKNTVLAVRDMTVFKHGRTTGLTRGVITDIAADIRVNYDKAGVGIFINTIMIRGVPPTTPFSAGGDSGSVILDAQNRVCALLFAGSNTSDVTFANPIRTVLRRLRVRLV